jgi:hypothetical protein
MQASQWNTQPRTAALPLANRASNEDEQQRRFQHSSLYTPPPLPLKFDAKHGTQSEVWGRVTSPFGTHPPCMCSFSSPMAASISSGLYGLKRMSCRCAARVQFEVSLHVLMHFS